MIILSTTTDKIQVVLGGNITTNQLQCYASYNDTTTTGITPGRNVVTTNNTTAVDLVGSPSSSTQRIVGYLSVYNKDTVNSTVTINQYISSTSYPIYKTTLLPGEKLEYQQGEGFRTIGVDGSLRVIVNQSGPIVTSSLQYAYVSTDQTINSTNYIDITSLNFSVKANKRYHFNFIIPYTTPQTFQGVKFSINGPSNSYLAYYSFYPSSTTSGSYQNALSSYDSPANVYGASTLNGLAKIEGIVYVTSDGTLTGRCGGEVANTIVVKKGAIVFYYELN